MKTNGYSSNRWRAMARKAAQGFVALVALGAAPRVAEAGPCTVNADCKNDPVGPTCDNGLLGTKTCIKFPCILTDTCNEKFPSQLTWCDNTAKFCKPDAENGEPFPAGAGACTSNNQGASVCVGSVCDPKAQTCGIALGNGTCQETKHCTSSKCQKEDPADSTYETCVECLVINVNADCKDSPKGKICDGIDHACVQCTDKDASQCPDGKNICDVTTKTCVECLESADCPSSKPDCDPVAKVCTKPCMLDTDCDTQTEWCKNPDGKAGTCTPKLPNGEKIPSVGNHTPGLDGKCTYDVAKAVCESGACDVDADVCGLNLHSGPCAATSQCNEGACVPGKGTCEPCLVDTDCTAPTPYCNTSTNQCGECKTTADCKDPSSPKCDPASSTCKPTCTDDSKCDPADWCNTSEGPADGVCTPDVPNGAPVPTSANHEPALDGKCTIEAGKAACQSGACSEKDNLCGLAGGEACSSNSAACRSNSCDSGVCTCEKDAHCGGPNSGLVCKIPDGPSNGTCVPGCRGTGNKCSDATCSSTSDAIAACADPGEYVAGAGLCSGSPSRGAAGVGLTAFGALLFFTTAAGRLARRRREQRKAS